MPYDLFINSSILIGTPRFIRIFPTGGVLNEADLGHFVAKYHRLYVAEAQRSAYLRSMCALGSASVTEKAAALRDSAIHHLDSVFHSPSSSEGFRQAIAGCRDVVDNLVDVLHDHDIDRLQELIASLSFHDFYTYDHSIDVAMYSILLFRTIHPGSSREKVVQAGMAGLLHDIGKIRVPTRILNFPGELSREDMDEIRKHPTVGRELLLDPALNLPASLDVELVARAVYQHHENFDGTGYPDKIAGNSIHEVSRIVSVVDFFDAVTTKRSYHDPLGVDEALALMLRSGGKKLDPRVFQSFADQCRHFRRGLNANGELPDSFDPCQPHSVLPFLKRKAA